MSMTNFEKRCKEYAIKYLKTQGYPTYAKLLRDFDLNLTEDPNVVAYMEPGKGRIVVNKTLDVGQISVIIRHEILHQYLKHEYRLLNKLASKNNTTVDDLDDYSIKELKKELYKDSNFNIAGDYEISNLGYTDKDKSEVHRINLNGKILSGLVTEDDHPDWVDLPIEDMYSNLVKEMKKTPKESENKVYGKFISNKTFISGDGSTIYTTDEAVKNRFGGN